MNAGTVGQAIGLFAITNVDDLVLIALFFTQTTALRIVLGQYLGFAAILAVSVVVSLGAAALPGDVVRWLGLIPLVLGLKALWGLRNDDDSPEKAPTGILAIAGITFANGGDNIGVYVPVFATQGVVVYVVVFLVMVAVLCLAGRFLATRPVVARALARWGHVLFPVVLIGIGVFILVAHT
ncbi:cadmium resistance transporter [Herbidospora sp. NBRC 101105]|uniref:cadmium resistance transporter n=1 Tax=Herbidospora sp. NBRC 101105 TaxID=3032195 RepID=UPI0024A13B85|nr:cadmium resistance transporter [Herbidospora sp. NBRC 101105]GLX95332.1 cadmium transporter [Herbidospora sp. NBRC 101105]